MKQFCAFVILFIIPFLNPSKSFSQKKEIKARLHKEHVETIPRDGAAIDIQVDDKSIIKEWETYLKSFGKLTKLKNSSYKVTEASVPGVSGACIIYAKCYSHNKGYLVWWSIDNGVDIIANSKSTEKKLEEFARQQYINDVNNQIKDAEDAVKSASKEQGQEVEKGNDLVIDIEKNGKEKVKLEEELKENSAELIKLKEDVEKNKVDQKAAAEETAKMQKALEVVKNKLNNL